MALANTLRLTQTTTLIINAELIQAIKLLPMARLELAQVIRQELMDNEMLEEVAPTEDGSTPTDEDDTPSPAEAADTLTDGQELYDIDWQEYFPDEGARAGLPVEATEARDAYDPAVCTRTTLSEHLLAELLLATTDAAERRVGAYLIGDLDDDGYWRGGLAEVMTATQTDQATVERVLALLQTFEPTGVGARDLRECLLLQIRARGLEGSLVETLVQEYWPTLVTRGMGALPAIAKELAKSRRQPAEEVALALQLLKQLDPAPGLTFASAPAEAIVPDVIVMKVGQDYQVFLNDEGIPRLRISATYRRLLRDSQFSQPEVKHYLEGKLRTAVGFIRSIEQRRQTLHKVATSLVKFQRDFLDHGLAHLKPLVLKDVAEDISMHESTVSRVTTNKYLYTEQGIFELKYFFHSGLESYGGETMSSLTVKDRLKRLVAAEEPAKPLTDQQLVEALAVENVKIARRTVAKYRRELKIPPANRRKQCGPHIPTAAPSPRGSEAPIRTPR
jgi:RNA polymerase sigma-54 factor